MHFKNKNVGARTGPRVRDRPEGLSLYKPYLIRKMMSIKRPILTESEEIILHIQGGYANIFRSGWKLGHFYLTNQRLIFFQPMGIVFETPLTNITNVKVEERFFVLRKKNVICLSYKYHEIGRTSKAWIIMGNLETWRKKIYEMTMPSIDEEMVNKIAQELDPVSQEILWYLWENGHATINELAELVEAPTHMEILLKIRETINPIAEKMTGNPILAFERSKIDQETGEKILFSWWLIGYQRPKEKGREALLDIFDEGDHIDIVMELLGVQEKDIFLRAEKDKLTVFAHTPDEKYQEEIFLPAEVSSWGFTKRYNNGILQVRLEKSVG